MCMGRKKLNISDDEIKKRNLMKSLRYYYKHREKILVKRMDRYWKEQSK